MRHIFKTFLLFTMMFSPQEGFCDLQSIEQLYHDRLKAASLSFSDIKQKAQKRKTAYSISAILAILLLFAFIYFFKLPGLIVALIMIGAGYYTLQTSQPVIGVYEQHFKRDIISPIAKQIAGFSYVEGKLSENDLKNSNLFSPRIKQFSSWDLYQNKGAKFSYIHVVFDTKENASIERMAENIFEGFLIMIDMKNISEGVLVSETLRDKVADMDLTMSSFFAKGKRAGKANGFDIYGEVSQEDIDKASMFTKKKIAISYQKDKTIIALYHSGNPLTVDLFQPFDIVQAKNYARMFEEIDHVIQSLK